MDSIAWICMSVAALPLLAFLSFKKPFIFPLGAYLFLLPFDSVLSLSGSGQGATLTKILGAISIPVLLVNGALDNRLKRPDGVVIWWVLLVVFGMISSTWAMKPEVVLNGFRTYVGLLLLYLVVSSYRFQKAEFEIIKKLILLGGIVAAVSVIFLYFQGTLLSEGRASLVVVERKTNPNLLAFSLLLPVSICTSLAFGNINKLLRGLYVFALGLIVLSIVLTGSRKGILGLGIIFVVYFILIKQKATFWMIILVLGMILLSFIPEMVFGRFGETVETGGGGRLAIWYVGWHALQKYWLTGVGLNHFIYAYTEFSEFAPVFMGYERGPHNIFLGIFVELGIVGFTFMMLAVIKHYRLIKPGVKSFDNDHIMLKAATLAILVACFFGTFTWDKSFWLIWMIILMQKNVQELICFEGTSIMKDQTVPTSKIEYI